MKGSIIFQVKTVIQAMDKIGESKALAKRVFNQKSGVHSFKQKKELTKTMTNFANWVRKEHDVKRLVDVNEKHYREYLESEKKHTKLDTRRGYETNLRLFQRGYESYCEKNNLEVNEFVTENRLISPRERSEGVSNRSLQENDIKALKSEISTNSR